MSSLVDLPAFWHYGTHGKTSLPPSIPVDAVYVNEHDGFEKWNSNRLVHLACFGLRLRAHVLETIMSSRKLSLKHFSS